MRKVGKITEIEKDIILALAKYDMNASLVSEKIYLAPSTLQYHIKQIKKYTGIDPLSFYGLVELLQNIRRPEYVG